MNEILEEIDGAQEMYFKFKIDCLAFLGNS